MTQTASISSTNKRKFLKKAFKGFSYVKEERNRNEHDSEPITSGNKLYIPEQP